MISRRSLNEAPAAILVSSSQSSSAAQLCISEDAVCVLLFGVYIHSVDLRAKRAHQFPPSASCCSSSHALAFRRTWHVIVTLSHSLSPTERGGDRAGQTPGRARLLLPGLSPWRPLLPPLLRAPGWLPPLAVLLPRRASHLSHCHAVQLVDRTDAGQDLRSTAWDFNRHYRCKLSL